MHLPFYSIHLRGTLSARGYSSKPQTLLNQLDLCAARFLTTQPCVHLYIKEISRNYSEYLDTETIYREKESLLEYSIINMDWNSKINLRSKFSIISEHRTVKNVQVFDYNVKVVETYLSEIMSVKRCLCHLEGFICNRYLTGVGFR